MKIKRGPLGPAIAVAILSSPAGARADAVPGKTITLEQALARAFAQSPEIRARAAEVQEAGGRLEGAETIQVNPVVEGAARQRKPPNGDPRFEWGVGLSQEISLSGTRGRRIDVAESALSEARARFERDKRLLATRVYAAFIEALKARELLDAAKTTAAVTEQLFDVSTRRLQAGSVTQLDVNLASAELGRAEGALHLAQAAFDEARAVLAESIGTTPTEQLFPGGDPPMTTTEPRPMAELLSLARQHREDLVAFRQAVQTAQARLALARAERFPAVTVRGFYEHEEGDMLVGGGVDVPIPIFNRNQGEVAESQAAARRAEAEAGAAVLRVEQEVVSAHARYVGASRTVDSLKRRVVGTISENMELLSKSFAAGKVGLTEVLVIRQSLLQSRADYIEALASLWRARIELDLAAGQLAIPEYRPSEDSP